MLAPPLRYTQFFETINPLSGFDGKEALETYLFDQSHRVEPKDPEKWETVKPSRPAHVLKSPGIKPPKISVHHQPLHQNSRTHKSALSPTTSFNSYVTDDSRQVPSSPTEDNAFAIVDINPGQQPRYVRDVPNAQLAQNLPGSQNRTIRSKNHSISTPPSPTHTPAPPLPPRRQASPLPPPPPKSLGLRDKSNSPRSPLSPAAS
uniref:Uncharacterized protein n=1 Tax=Plectus sambesii TaxID=2011161 RepID=A0A914XEN1_9BILA